MAVAARVPVSGTSSSFAQLVLPAGRVKSSPANEAMYSRPSSSVKTSRRSPAPVVGKSSMVHRLSTGAFGSRRSTRELGPMASARPPPRLHTARRCEAKALVTPSRSHFVPSKCRSTPVAPTAKTSSSAVPCTEASCAPSTPGACSNRSCSPSKKRMTPCSPTNHVCRASRRKDALSVRPCGSGYSQHQPSGVQSEGSAQVFGWFTPHSWGLGHHLSQDTSPPQPSSTKPHSTVAQAARTSRGTQPASPAPASFVPASVVPASMAPASSGGRQTPSLMHTVPATEQPPSASHSK